MGAIVGVVGGTGKQGSGLVRRWARSHEVILGSRDRARAEAEAKACGEAAGAPGRVIRAGTNAEAARGADLVALCVPYAAHAETLRELAPDLQGKVVLDMTVPLAPPRVTVVHLPAGRAAALEAQAILGPGARVVAALHHVSSAHLADLEHALEGDVLVCGDDAAAKASVIELVADLGMRGVDAGPLENAIAIEALTPVLLHINRRYKVKGAGVRILGIP
ncbi:MAG: NADPH-dependent F420 reductase [Polyangiaceae bacterium]|nr:NADPH-dependent F420 reductase [Polyangiaceae bacterium]